MKKLFLLLPLIAFILSCGPSAQEKAALRENLQYKLKDANVSLQKAKEIVMNKKAEYEIANDAMNKIKGFHVLRTDAEREDQIKNQSLQIQSIQQEISKAEENVKNAEMTIAGINYEIEKIN